MPYNAQGMRMIPNTHFGIGQAHRVDHEERTTCRKYGCVSFAQAEINAAREYESLKAQYQAEEQAAYEQHRDADTFELTVRMISLCERFGWELEGFLK